MADVACEMNPKTQEGPGVWRWEWYPEEHTHWKDWLKQEHEGWKIPVFHEE